MTICSIRCNEIAILVHACSEHAGRICSRVLGNSPHWLTTTAANSGRASVSIKVPGHLLL